MHETKRAVLMSWETDIDFPIPKTLSGSTEDLNFILDMFSKNAVTIILVLAPSL